MFHSFYSILFAQMLKCWSVTEAKEWSVTEAKVLECDRG